MQSNLIKSQDFPHSDIDKAITLKSLSSNNPLFIMFKPDKDKSKVKLIIVICKPFVFPFEYCSILKSIN